MSETSKNDNFTNDILPLWIHEKEIELSDEEKNDKVYSKTNVWSVGAELLIGVGLGRKVRQLLRREVGQELAENERRAALVIALRKRFPIRVGKRGKRGRAVQAAVRCDTVGDGVCPAETLRSSISCAYIIHIFTTSAVVLIASSICIANMYVWAIGNSVDIPPSCHNIFCIKLNALS